MNMNRRQALGVIGTFLAAPTLLVDKPKKKIIRSDEEIIPTGFPTLDTALGGGLRRGTINIIIGCQGSGKTAFMRSVALKAAEKSSIAVIPERHTAYLSVARGVDVRPFEGHLWYYPYDYMDQHGEPDLWRGMMEKHDIIFDESLTWAPSHWSIKDRPRYQAHKVRVVSQLAQEHDCAVVWTVGTNRTLLFQKSGHPSPTICRSSLHYMSSTIFSSTIFSMGYGIFHCKLVKNRWGNFTDQEMLLDTTTLRMVPLSPINFPPENVKRKCNA